MEKPKKNPYAVALGRIKTAKKSSSSRLNGIKSAEKRHLARNPHLKEMPRASFLRLLRALEVAREIIDSRRIPHPDSTREEKLLHANDMDFIDKTIAVARNDWGNVSDISKSDVRPEPEHCRERDSDKEPEKELSLADMVS